MSAIRTYLKKKDNDLQKKWIEIDVKTLKILDLLGGKKYPPISSKKYIESHLIEMAKKHYHLLPIKTKK